MAKVKVDAEMLKKQHFWVLQLVMIIPLLVAIFGVFGVSEATDAKIAAADKEKKTIEGTKAQSKFKLEELEKQKGVLFKQLDSMWLAAWDSQKAIFTWPQGLQEKHREALKDLKFGTDLEALRRENKFPDLDSLKDQFHPAYVKEFESMPDKIAPLHFNGGLNAVVKYVKKFPAQPSVEDLYLAMEDLWVQTKMVEALDGVNRRFAEFQAVGATPENRLNRKFRSPLWELDLEVEESDDRKERWLKGKIKNITNRLLGLGEGNQTILEVWVDADPRSIPIPFTVEGEQIPAGETVVLKKIPANKLRSGQRLDEFVRVRQAFDIKTVPIKRIDRLEMGYKSNRQQVRPLKMAPISDKAIADLAGPAADPAAQQPAPGETTPGAPPTNALSPCGLVRRRYIDVTRQVRRMPIGLVVICEQSYIQDVLVALANTPLRFQITQEHFKRSRDLTAVNPPYDPSSTPAPAAPVPAGPAPAAAPGSEGRPGGVPLMPGRPSAPGLETTNTPPADQTSNNLVELAVYGVASLYEKYVPSGPAAAPPAEAPVKKQ